MPANFLVVSIKEVLGFFIFYFFFLDTVKEVCQACKDHAAFFR